MGGEVSLQKRDAPDVRGRELRKKDLFDGKELKFYQV
jgi:hypothetical protein